MGVEARQRRQQPALGLGPNAGQFALLVAINALVGGMVGQQQTVLPLLAQDEFGLTGYTFIFTYVVAFGITKAAANYVAGTWSDRYGRKPVLVAGWLLAIPVPLLLIWAPSWAWVVAANVLLGISQGLTWSTTVIMKIDLVGPRRRGLAMGQSSNHSSNGTRHHALDTPSTPVSASPTVAGPGGVMKPRVAVVGPRGRAPCPRR